MAITIGDRLRRLREEAGLTQEALAAACDPPLLREHVSHYETGSQIPGWIVLPRLARALGLSQSELVGDADFQRPTPPPRRARRAVARRSRIA